MNKDPSLKGKKGENCNVEACQSPGAWWYNKPMRAYYCTRCARRINDSSIRHEMEPICTYEGPKRMIKGDRSYESS